MLVGQHRFARYALAFRLHPLSGGRTLVRAETRARFPGLRGGLYRAFVIDSRGHNLLMRQMLAALARRADQA